MGSGMTSGDWLNRHMVFRRLALVWAVCLITWVVVRVFTDLTLITSAVAMALGSVTVLLTGVVGLHQYGRFRQNNWSISRFMPHHRGPEDYD